MVYYGLVWNFTRDDLHTPGVSSGLAILVCYMFIGNYPSASDGTVGYIIFYARDTSSLAIPIYYSISIVGMY